MGHADMDAVLKRIKQVGEANVGEELPRLKQKKREKQRVRYPQNPEWFHAEVNK